MPPFTARPHAATPIAVLGSDAVLLTLIGAAAAQRSYLFAGYLFVASLIPWAPRERLRWIGVLLAYGGIGLGIFGVFQVPIGARVTALYLPAIVAFLARIRALGAESVLRWIRFPQSITAAPTDPGEAMERALRAPMGRSAHAIVDAAVVALAAAPRAAIPEAEADRRAFWINVYNTLALHAGRGRDSIRVFLVMEVFRTRYEVAGLTLTLDEIEHGLLRDGAAHPALPSSLPGARMSRADPRRAFAVPLDPRVHFALHCGAASCPKVRVYQGATLEEDLALAEEAFLRAVSRYDAAAGVMETSKILSWYAADFGGERGVRLRLGRALDVPLEEAERARLVFSPYDWTSTIT